MQILMVVIVTVVGAKSVFRCGCSVFNTMYQSFFLKSLQGTVDGDPISVGEPVFNIGEEGRCMLPL
jgi:hypothetical protein